jgi:hypothetical protein
MGLLSQLPAAIEALDIEALIEAIWMDARLGAASAAAVVETSRKMRPRPRVRPASGS